MICLASVDTGCNKHILYVAVVVSAQDSLLMSENMSDKTMGKMRKGL